MIPQYKTKEFWLQVQKEFEENPSQFLCWASKTFANVFESKDMLVKDYFSDMAEKFLKEQPEWVVFFTALRNYCLLFKAHDPVGTTCELRQQLRKAFVDWTIKNLTDDTTTQN